ncbi:chemotaxis protein CheB [Nitrosococcus wardiae]|uniref:histidine kinase n=1 Tax=Nitrosococcus wardiae TaxID=1814290 RepID=A0A4P7C4M1_9GAMM|nr:chemotaxis protein CheB [Nitrosococcus wardiae]QBQ55812.1 response regulator [Nitrosococcus wardiae]
MTDRTLDPPSLTIVGIGASAGGLAALKAFFASVPEDSGLAFVVVIHLSPEHKSHLAELLQPHIQMPVEQVTETVPLEANHVYVIPPGRNLSTIDTHLRLTQLEEKRRERMPIDHFFRTLARTHNGHAIGVILTGTGADGTLGVKELKEMGGLTLVQDPLEAEFDGMPQSAIATGLIDLILPLRKIPEAILRFAHTKPHVAMSEEGEEVKAEQRQLLQKIFAQIRARTGRDFTYYKRSTILRRIKRRMQLAHIEELAAYIDCLQTQPNEVRTLADDLLITVTNFFRDPEVFETLEEEVIPRLFEGKGPDGDIRLWSVGCATGEEAYSLAILLEEAAARYEAQQGVRPRLQVFASDLHEHSLEKARDGFYPGDIAADVSPERLRRFFHRENGGFRVKKEVRERVIFAPHNLLGDPPFSRLDLIACRNMLIYLQREMQRDVFELFHYALKPGGYLVLGMNETVDRADLFRLKNKRHCLYRKRNVPTPEPHLPVFPLARAQKLVAPPRHGAEAPVNYSAVYQHMVERYGPPSLLVSPDDQVVQLSAPASRYLAQPGGEPTLNVFKYLREELQLELRAALHRAREKRQVTHTKPVPVALGDDTPHPVVLHVHPALELAQEGFVLILFDERAPTFGPSQTPSGEGEASDARTGALEAELDLTRQRLQAIIEEHETSQEEMKAANEELQSANEELRSTLEELETSKEELQSMNEELQTVNQENRHKVEELGQLSGDLQNLMAATDIATLFLDRDLRILRFTPKVSDLFNVRLTDRGRPLSDLTHRLGSGDLIDDAVAVLQQRTQVERELEDKAGHWYLTRVLPYWSTAERIEGVVITFVDITNHKHAEQAIRKSEERLRRMINIEGLGVMIFDQKGTIMDANETFLHMFGYSRAEVEAKALTGRTLTPVAYIARSEQQLQELAQTGRIGPYEKEYLCKDGSRSWMLFVGASLGDGTVIEYCIDVSDRKRAEAALQETSAQLRRQTAQLQEEDRHKNEFLGLLGHELRNPLAIISTTLELLQRTTVPPDEYHQRIDRIKLQVKHLLRLVDDLLNITRISRGQIHLKKAPLNWIDSILEAVDQVRPQIEAHHHRLTLNLPERPIRMEADQERLTQIVANLLSNAAHYTPDGGEITLKLARANGEALLRVRDNGIGIALEDLPHLFEPFHRLETSTEHYRGGLGLGLALARQLTELHGGRLEAFSAGHGEGSEFTVRLPVLPEGPSVEPVPPPPDPQTEVPVRRILLVEDNQDAAESLATLLQAQGHAVQIASRGSQTVEAVRTFHPQVVLLDIGLPDMSGYDVAQRLRQEPGLETLPLVALTGYGREKDRQQAQAAGFDGHLLKPVSLETLQALLQDL